MRIFSLLCLATTILSVPTLSDNVKNIGLARRAMHQKLAARKAHKQESSHHSTETSGDSYQLSYVTVYIDCDNYSRLTVSTASTGSNASKKDKNEDKHEDKDKDKDKNKKKRR